MNRRFRFAPYFGTGSTFGVKSSPSATYKKRCCRDARNGTPRSVWLGIDPRSRDLGISERPERGSFVKACREVADKTSHGWMPEPVKSKKIHFIQRRLRLPAFDRHSISRNEHTRAVFAEAAVDEDLFL